MSDVVAASEGEVNLESFNRLIDRALAHRFYFSQEQCDEVTKARVRVEDKRKGDIRMIVPTLRADPLMDDSYFILE